LRNRFYEKQRAKSNHTFVRLAAAQPSAVAMRYGYKHPEIDLLTEQSYLRRGPVTSMQRHI